MRVTGLKLGIGGSRASNGGRWKLFAVKSEEDTERRIAQPRRLFEHRIEHRREIAGRRVDDLQHLGGRGLLLQRLAGLGDQPRVLHRDHRLRREILQQRDLLVGKRPDFLAVDAKCAKERGSFA